MIIDHIGIVVKDINKGIDHWKSIFNYSQMTNIVLNTRQKVKVVFMEKEGSLTVKLIEPTDEKSPIYSFSKKGGGLHHICFKCDNLFHQLEEFSKQGLRILAQPQPGEAFDNENIAFVYANQGLNIELIDTDKKASKLVP
jgi:methylmalonyl-CoA/ethylmalonyl-CoA epimerase